MNNPSARRPIDYYVLWIVALISLGINVYLLNTLLQTKKQVALAAGTAAVAVEQLRASAIDYTIPIQQSLPVSLTVAYKQTLSVPINVVLPINTNVTVPLNTPLGNFPINVPVSTTVPVNMNPQVPLDLEVPISTTVPVSLSVPIHLALSDTAFDTSLASAEDYLNSLATQLGAPGPTPTP